MFDAGSAVFTLTGRVVRTPFEDYGKLVEGARANKEHRILLGADTSGAGFEKFQGWVERTKQSIRDFLATAKAQLDTVGASVDKMAGASDKSLGGLRDSVVKTGDTFKGLGDSSKGMADVVSRESSRAAKSVAVQADEHRASTDSMIRDTRRLEEATAGGAGGGGRGGVPAIIPGGGHGGEHPAETAKKTTSAWKEGFNTLANLGKWVTGATAIVGGVAIKWAADFQRQMELIHTQAGYTQKQVETLTKSVLNLSPAVGIGPEKLARGLYHITSVLQGRGGTVDAMNILKYAAEGAAVGQADMEDTANALASILANQPKDIHSVAEAMGVMNDIVGKGNLRMEDLNRALSSQLLQAAKSAGLGLRDVGAALDVMTSRGAPAEQSATRLRTLLGLLESPTAKAQKALEQLGFSQSRIAQDMRQHGLVYALEDLQNGLNKTFPPGRKMTLDQERNALEQYGQQLEAAGVHGKTLEKDLAAFKHQMDTTGSSAIQQSQLILQAFGGARTGATMLTLMQNVDDVKKHFQGLNQADAAGRFQKAWQATQKDFSRQVAGLGASLQTFGIRLGDWLIPKVKAFVEALITAGKWLGHHKVLADALAIAFGTVLTGAVVAFFSRLVLRAAEGAKAIGRLGKEIAKLPLTMARAVGGLGRDIGKIPEKMTTATSKMKESVGRFVSWLRGEHPTVNVQEEVAQEGGGAAGPGGAAEEAAAADVEGMIHGIGGTMGPGSEANPIMVMMKAASQMASTISGVKGELGAPGSYENPIAVVVMASESYGVGSRGAAAEAKTETGVAGQAEAAASRETAPVAETSSVPLGQEKVATPAPIEAPAEAAAVAPAEAAATGEGAMAGEAGMMGAMGPAAMIGMGGFIGSQMIGGAVGGKTGAAISGVGGMAAMGAGIGTMIAPGIGTAAGAGIGGIIGALTSIPGATKAVTEAFKAAFDWISKASGDVAKFVSGVWHGFTKEFGSIIKPIEGIFKGVWGGIKDYFGGIVKVFEGAWKIISALFSGDWGKLWKGVKEVFSGIWQVIIGIAKTAWSILSGEFKVGIAILGKIWGGIIWVIEEPFKLAWAAVKALFGVAKDLIKGGINGVVDIIKSAWHVVTSIIPNAISSGFHAALKFVQGLPGSFENAAGSIVKSIGKGLSSLGSDALGIVKSGINTGILGPINGMIHLLDTIKIKIPKIHIHLPDPLPNIDFGGTSIGFPHIGEIHKLQTGGFVPGDPQRDSTLVGAAGGELMVTAHGQQMMEAAAPGLVNHVAQNQLPHPQTTSRNPVSSLTGLGGIGTQTGRQLGGVSTAATQVARALGGMGGMAESVRSVMTKDLTNVTTTTDTQLKKTHDVTNKHIKDITKLHKDFGNFVTQNIWDTYGGKNKKGAKAGPDAPITDTITDAWDNLKTVTQTYTDDITNISKMANKTDLSNTQTFHNQLVQAHKSIAHDVAAAEVNLAQSAGNIIGQADTATYTGIQTIFSDLEKGLSTLGVKSSLKFTGSNPNIAKSLAGLGSLIPYAGGGILPGSEFGHGDMMTLVDPLGRPRAKMAGDEAIFNRHQMPFVEAGLQMLGFHSADDLWSKVNTPHGAGYEKGGKLPGFATGGYVYPIGPGLSPGRLDEGFDFSGSGVNAAIGPARILRDTIWPGWPGSGGVVYKLLSGPRAGQNVYIMEHVQALVRAGQTVNAGQAVARILDGFPFEETGWADAAGLGPLTPYNGAPDGTPMPGAKDFQAFISGLAHGKIVGSAMGLVGAPPWNDIKVPHVKGAGPMSDMARAALKRVTNAANKYGQQHSPVSTGTTSGTGIYAFGATPPGGYTPTTWAQALMKGLGVGHPNQQAIQDILAWEQQEGGNWNNNAHYNPLNTTMGAPGASSINSVGVKSYTSWAEGLQATLQTLNNGSYAGIVGALKSGAALGTFKSAVNSSPWGTVFASGGYLPGFQSGGNPWAPLSSYLRTLPGFRPPRTRRGRGGLHTVGRGSGATGGSRSLGKTGSSATGTKRAKTETRPRQPISQTVANTLTALGFGNFVGDQNKLGTLDNLYQNQENLFQMFDTGGGSLPLQDLDTLMDIREQQWDILYGEHLALPAAISQMGYNVAAIQGSPGGWGGSTQHTEFEIPWNGPGHSRPGHRRKRVTRAAGKPMQGIVPELTADVSRIENEISSLGHQLQLDSRQISVIHHNVSAQVMSLADNYAGKTATYLNELSVIQDAKYQNSLRRQTIAAQIRSLPTGGSSTQLSLGAIVSGVMSGQLPSTGSTGNPAKKSLQNQAAAISTSDTKLSHAETIIRRQQHDLLLKKDAAARQYRQQGFDAAWAITIQKWKIQDLIYRLKLKLKKLKEQLKRESDAGKADANALQTLQNWQTGGLQGSQSIDESLEAIAFDILGLYQQGADLPTPGRQTPTLDTVTGFLRSMGLQIPTDITGGGSESAAQAFTDFTNFQASRASLFQTFGSNFVPAGTSPLSSSAGIGAGVQFYGAASGPAAGLGGPGGIMPGFAQGGRMMMPQPAGETTINIHQNFAAGPPDPHTYSAGLVYELGAMT